MVAYLMASVLFLYRLQFGVDFQDEGQLNAFAWTLAEGRSVSHDFSLVQNGALLLSYIDRLFASVTGDGATGLVFFHRIIYFALCFGFAIAAHRLLRPAHGFLGLPPLFALSFVPFSIPTPSYNTLSMLLLTASFLTWARAREENSHRDRAIAFALGCAAAFAHPSLLPICIVTVALCLVDAMRARRTFWRFVLFPLLPFAALATTYVFTTGIDHIVESVAFARSHRDLFRNSTERWVQIQNQIEVCGPFIAIMVATFLVAGLLRSRRWQLVGLIGFPLGYWAMWHAFPDALIVSKSHLLVTGAAVAAPILMLRERPHLWVSLLSLGAGINGAWMSSNGLHNFAPPSLASLVLVAHHIVKSPLPLNRAAAAVFVVFVQAFLMWQYFGYVYGDDSAHAKLTARIESGPFKSLRTTPEKKKFADQVHADLKQISHGTIAIFDFGATFYMFTRAQPQTPALWTYAPKMLSHDREKLRAYFMGRGKGLPDVWVWVGKLPLFVHQGPLRSFDFPPSTEDSLFAWFLRQPYEPVLKRPEYTIYRRKSTHEQPM